jgi:hypothetical protein
MEEAAVEEATCKGGQQGRGLVWSSLVSGTLRFGTTAGGDGEWRRTRVLADWAWKRRTLGLGCQARGSVWPYSAFAGAASRSHMVHCG